MATSLSARVDAPRAALRLFGVLLTVDLLVLVVHLVAGQMDIDNGPWKLDGERNFPTAINTIQYLGVGVFGALAGSRAHGRSRLAWIGVAVLFTVFAADDWFVLHEELEALLAGNDEDPVWFWPLLLSPIFVAAIVALIGVAGDARRFLGSAVPIVVGLGCLGLALLLDVGAATLDAGRALNIETLAEEALELVGSAVLLVSAYAVSLCRSARPGAGSP